MNVNELNRLFSHPDEVSRAHFSDIRDMLAAYPFVSAFHLLYQKGLSNENDVICDSELHRTALFSPDRNRLMLLLMPKPVEKVADSLLQAQQPTEVKPVETVQVKPTVTPVAKPVTKVSDVAPTPVTKISETLTPEQPAANDAADGQNSMRFAAEVDAFLSHFESAQASRKAQADDDAPLKVQRVNVSQEDDDADDDASATKQGGADDAPTTEFFTETLAKIYIKQEKFLKAIHIFEELCVRCPEKKEYFNEQIRFLQKLIKYL